MLGSSRATSPYGLQVHREGVERLLRSYRNIPERAPVRLAKKTSNLFRARAKVDAPGLDVSGLGGVVSVSVASTLIAEPTLVNLATRLRPWRVLRSVK